MTNKKIKAVEPYIYPDQLNFKDQAFRAWKAVNNNWVRGWYPKWLHGVLFRWDLFYPLAWFCRLFLPSSLPKSLTTARRLVFVQPVSLYFDAGVSVVGHEVVPMIWDCWPCYYDRMERWMKRYRVKLAFFTSRQEMEAMQLRCPEVEMRWCPEAVECGLYAAGKGLKDRTIDVLEFGRGWDALRVCDNDIKWVRTQVDGRFIYSDEELRAAMGDAKVTICLPRSVTHPALAQGVETLTQRYWEAMLSRMVIVGHAPQELIDIVGYNPVVEIRKSDYQETRLSDYQLIWEVLEHIEDYQALVDRNRAAALEHGDWKGRVKQASLYTTARTITTAKAVR